MITDKEPEKVQTSNENKNIKGVSTWSPPPIFDSISDEKACKEVIRAHKKFGRKRTNRFRAMVKNSKKVFNYGF